MEALKECYYQSSTVWSDDKDNRFKVIFGFFNTEEEALEFNQKLSLCWSYGRFEMTVYTDNGKQKNTQLDDKDITFLDESPIKDFLNLYPELLDDSVSPWNRFKILRCQHKEVIRHERVLNLEQAYKEVWRLVFDLFNQIAHVIQYNGEIDMVGSALDNALMIWKKAGELMQGKIYGSDAHNERLIKTYDLLSTIFKGVDTDESFNVIKYGQSSTYSKLFNGKNDDLINGKYIFR